MVSTAPQASPRAASLGAARLARMRNAAYRILATVFLYPEAGRTTGLRVIARELLEAEHPWAAFAFYPGWRRLLERLADPTEPEAAALAAQYARLFLVQPAAPPHAGYYLDPAGSAAGWLNARLGQVYAQSGVAAAGEGRDGPDFVATQLEFMAWLCDREERAWARRRRGQGLALVERQRAFLSRYLAPWFPLFARQVRQAAGGSLFATAAQAAEAFICHDLDLLHCVSQGCRDAEAAERR